MGVATCCGIGVGVVSFSTTSTFFTLLDFCGGTLEKLTLPFSSVHLYMSPQAVAGMTSDIMAGNTASNQSRLRGSPIAAVVLPDLWEAITTMPSLVTQIPTKKV